MDLQTSLNHIETLIAIEAPFQKVMRLLCMLSLAENGIKEKQYMYIKKEIFQVYGFHHILTFQNLEKVGLIKKANQKSNNWPSIKKHFKLIKEDINMD